jgi:two-component system sensor histidine kinase QseC
MRSLRSQLTRTLTLALAVLLGAGLAIVYFSLRVALTEQFDQALLAKALALAATLAYDNGATAPLSDRLFPQNHKEDTPREFFEIRRADGTVVARSPSLEDGALLRKELRGARPHYWSLTLPTGQPGRAVGLLVEPLRGATGAQRIVVAGDREELDEALTTVLAAVAGSGALLLLATVVLVPRTLRRGLRPLDALAAQAAQIDARSLDTRFAAAAAPEELQPIATRLNDLLARLEQSFERERRVSADLAHELRTPLAELRVVAESALKWPEAREASTDRETLAIAAQMESIVERMLALARSEGGRLKLVCETVELSSFVETVWRSFGPRAGERRLGVTFDLQPATVVTDPVLLRSILANLLDNAVDYTPAGGKIVLACGPIAGSGVRVTVTNATENLASDDVERLFERFWRKEAARSSAAHVGLGLALVRAFAGALGWEIDAHLDEQQRLTFELRGKDSATGVA